MTGFYHLTISNASVKYDLTIRRNITIIKGDSASGKTVLIDMIRDFALSGPDSGISLSCPIPCRVVEGNTWEEQLASINESLVFIDEGNRFVSSDDFAAYVREGKNYYIIVTREKLSNLPISVSEIYGIKSSGKYESLVPVYHETYRIYEEYTHNLPAGERITPDEIITEDSNSGFEFFCAITSGDKNPISCLSAGGKSKVFELVSGTNDLSILVIADGAAFGAEMEHLCELIRSGYDLHLFLPESFEWLILRSDVIKNLPRDEVDHPENYADSRSYFSWERYFSDLLIQYTRDTYMAYSKTRLNDFYKQDAIIRRILKTINGINFDKEEG